MNKQVYIDVLRKEIETLKKDYYKPNEEGTGHFNTAISVLEHRIKDVEKLEEVEV
jgi:hypothetical protein